MRRRKWLIRSTLAAAILVGACATAPSSKLPYPAFEQADDMAAAFTAALPGTRAKELFVDRQAGHQSLLLLLPADWHWNTSGEPGKSVEIFVLEGEITLGDLSLRAGNYAYLPPGSMGMTMSTSSGARLLYFLDKDDPHAVIRTPLYMSRDVLPWKAASGEPEDRGLQVKILRYDPGSGARTWLLKVDPDFIGHWHKSSVLSEGILLSGDYRRGECAGGKVVSGGYLPGGYFRRPAGAVNGGPQAGSEEGAVWFLREPARGEETTVDSCGEP